MYRSAKSGTLFAIVIGKDGQFRQFELTASGPKIEAKLVRQFSFGSIAKAVRRTIAREFFTSRRMRGICVWVRSRRRAILGN